MTTYTLRFENRPDYLYAYLTGIDSHAASIEYWTAIATEVNATDVKKVLVHENLTGQVTEAEIFDIVTRFVEVGFLGIKIAFYDENSDDEEINALGALVSKNRGAMVKVFHTLQDATEWIEQ